jgi:hypothetical protein
MVDGEGSYTALLFGTVIQSTLNTVPKGFAVDITLGEIQPEDYGVIVNAGSGGVFYEMEADQVEGFMKLAALARGRPRALYVDVKLSDEGRMRGEIGRHWGAPLVTLGAQTRLKGQG